MRIPGRKIYRAFPELDRFTDEQCVNFLRVISLRRWWMRFVASVVWVVTFIVLMFVYFWIVDPLLNNGWLDRLDQVVLFQMPGWGAITSADLLVTVVNVGLFFVLPTFVAILTRDRMLSRALGRHILGARCPGCKQSLIGLPIDPDEAGNGPRTRCPECGRMWVLRDLGLTPADLRPDAGPVGA